MIRLGSSERREDRLDDPGASRSEIVTFGDRLVRFSYDFFDNSNAEFISCYL